MIPRWLLPTFGLSAVFAFLADQVATYVVPDHVSNPAVTGVFGSIAAAAYLLGKGSGDKSPSKPDGKDGQ